MSSLKPAQTISLWPRTSGPSTNAGRLMRASVGVFSRVLTIIRSTFAWIVRGAPGGAHSAGPSFHRPQPGFATCPPWPGPRPSRPHRRVRFCLRAGQHDAAAQRQRVGAVGRGVAGGPAGSALVVTESHLGGIGPGMWRPIVAYTTTQRDQHSVIPTCRPFSTQIIGTALADTGAPSPAACSTSTPSPHRAGHQRATRPSGSGLCDPRPSGAVPLCLRPGHRNPRGTPLAGPTAG